MPQVENLFVTLNNFFAALKELLSLGMKRKASFPFAFRSLIRNFALIFLN